MNDQPRIKLGVGAIITNAEGKIFLGKRSQKVDRDPGKWEAPGGKVEFGETMVETLHRELREEHGVKIEVGARLDLIEYVDPAIGQHWIGPAYICKITNGTPQILEPDICAEIGWFSLEETKHLPLTVFAQRDLKNYEEYLANHPLT